MSENAIVSGDSWAALVLHATCTGSSKAIGYSTYRVKTDDGVIECQFLGFDANAKAVFRVDELTLMVGGEAFLQKLRVSGLSIDFGYDGKVGVSWDKDSVSVKANLGGLGVEVGLKIGITLPGVKISIDFVRLYHDLGNLIQGAAADFAEGFTAGMNGNATNYDRHIIVVARLDISAAAQHFFGPDWRVQNDNGTAFGWYATNGQQRRTFDGSQTLDAFAKHITRGMRGDYGSRHFNQKNPHSWFLVRKFHGPPSMTCPYPERCDGRRCKQSNDLSQFVKARPLHPTNFVTFQRPEGLVRIAVGQAHHPRHRVMLNHDSKSQSEWNNESTTMSCAGWHHQMAFWSYPERRPETIRLVVSQAWDPHRAMIFADVDNDTASWNQKMEIWVYPKWMPGTIRVAMGVADNPFRMMLNHDGLSQTEWNKGASMSVFGWKHKMEFWAYP